MGSAELHTDGPKLSGQLGDPDYRNPDYRETTVLTQSVLTTSCLINDVKEYHI